MLGSSTRSLRLSFVAALAIATLVFTSSAQTPPLVETALATMDRTELDDWSYTVTTTREGLKTIERHHATKPENARWQLLLKNGENPTADDLAEYDQSKNRRESERSKREKKDSDDRISSMIEPGSLSLVAEDDAGATYRFRMNADDDDEAEFTDHVRGTLVVDKRLPHIVRLEMQNTDEIRPLVGVKISEFRMVMSFVADDATGAVLPSTIATRIEGRAFLVKSLDEDISVTFSEFEYSKRRSPAQR